MEKDELIKDNIRHSFICMLTFYGLKFDRTSMKVTCITRILTCLKTFGLRDEANAFYDILKIPRYLQLSSLLERCSELVVH